MISHLTRDGRPSDDDRAIDMNWFLVISCVVGSWAMLRIVGGEQARLVNELQAKILREAKKAADAARVKAEEPIIVSSAPPAPMKPMPGLTPPKN